MYTCVVRPFGTANANATVPRTFGDRALAPRLGDRGIAVDAELRPASGDDAEEAAVVVVAARHQLMETVRATRRPLAVDLDDDRALRRVELHGEPIRRARGPARIRSLSGSQTDPRAHQQEDRESCCAHASILVARPR
jgi:hypothetical protein